MQLKKTLLVPVLMAFMTIPAYAVSDKKAAIAFNKADKNSDSSLNLSEFELFIRQMAKLGNPNAARAVSFGFVGFRFSFINGCFRVCASEKSMYCSNLDFETTLLTGLFRNDN